MICLKSPVFAMNRVLRFALYRKILLKAKVRRFSENGRNAPKVKIADESQDSMRISFKYGSSAQNVLSIVALKQEEVESVLSKIKRVVFIQRQKEELRRSVINKYSSAMQLTESAELVEVFEQDDIDVCLIHNDQHLDSNIPNIEAWTQGSFLKIGHHVYEVDHNTPTVRTLSLPKRILAGFAIRPHFIFEYANAYDSIFVWYRSACEQEVAAVESDVCIKVGEQWWIKVHEGFTYWTSKDDIERRLRVVCTPKLGERSGHTFFTESADVVYSGPENFPFEERHLYTKQAANTDSIRCLSYNILANVYVETKKFPYCSQVAKDIYYRKQLLLKELLGYNSDILCLQEVQERMFEYDLLPVLQNAGFEGYYMKKGGRRHEGLSCFFRSSKFRVLSKEGVLLNEIIKKKNIFNDLLARVSGNYKDMSKLLTQDTALQIVLLEHVGQPEKRILVANTHLYSNKDTPEVRLIQSALCVSYIEHVLKMQDGSTALLFCGDFNSLPDSSALEFLLKGSFECCSSWNKSASDTTLRHTLLLDSACGFPAYTNYTDNFVGCLDYIFYNKNFFSVSEIVPLPSDESVTQNVGLPSELFPSDHLPIICTLKWK